MSFLSLCWSRACLGKMSVFIYNWLNETVFLPVSAQWRGQSSQMHSPSPTQPSVPSHCYIRESAGGHCFQCSSCLSRACHGKSQRNDRFILKQENGWAKTARSHLAGNDTARKPASDHALASAALCQPLPLSQLLPPMMKLESTLAVGCIPPKNNATLF